MSVYEQTLRVRSSDVDMHRRLRTSVLFGWLQEASIAHTEALGMGRDKTLDRGILWVLGLITAQLARVPSYDEDVVLRTWPGNTMHVLFPRHYALETASGEPLVRACALWTLVDAAERTLVFPERAGIAVQGVTAGDELPIPSAPRPLPLTEESAFTVPYSYVDLNGHMNNTRYFDLADDVLPAAAAGRPLTAVTAKFSREARFGDTLTLRRGTAGDRYYLAGETDRGVVFRLSMTYGAEEK